MKNTLMALVAVLFTVTLTACNGDTPDHPAGSDDESNTYRGETISCIKIGMASTIAKSCNYDSFYAKHPDLLAEPIAGEDTTISDVWWTTYKGEKMPCMHGGTGKTEWMSCDFVWFFHEHPDLV